MIRFLQNTALLLFSTLISIIAIELMITHRIVMLDPLTPQGHVDFRELARRAALARGATFDDRSLQQVVTEARQHNKRSFPAVSPAYFLSADGSRVKIDGNAVLPLGIAANADNFYCNESGEFATFATDRFGFRNADSVWAASADIVAVGDSFTMGSCLKDDDTIVGNLRRSATVLNLGMGANGPLIELASLREFAAAVKPKVILWNFFPNDMTEDLERDRQNTILMQYLKSDFSQNLRQRNDAVQPVVDQVIEDYWRAIKTVNTVSHAPAPQPFFSFPGLRRLYQALLTQLNHRKVEPEFKIDLFMKILQTAKSDAETIGAKLFFVYIPDCRDDSYGQNIWKARLLRDISSAGIPVIDTEPSVKAATKGGQDAFFYCPGSHLAPAGAKAAAAEISKSIAASTGLGKP